MYDQIRSHFGCCGREWSNSQPLPLEGIGDRKANSEGRSWIQRDADSGHREDQEQVAALVLVQLWRQRKLDP